MDDLAGKLNEILNNPTEMAKFQQMANNLLGQMNTCLLYTSDAADE